MALSTIGNLGSYSTTNCASANLPETANSASYIGFKCEQGKRLTSLHHFGLAFQNETCTGKGIDASVRTIDRCTVGSMDNAQLEANIEN